MKQVEFLKKLENLGKSYLTISDLQMILEETRATTRRDAHRFVQRGILKKIGPDVYVSAFSSYEIEEIAGEIYAPCYLSFESALAKYGILGQIPYTITFATTRRSKKMDLGGREIEFRKLKPKVFFGYKFQRGLAMAEPEKALLDELYLVSLGKAKLDWDELSLKGLSFEKAKRMAEKFPLTVQRKLKKLAVNWGEVSLTVR